MSERSISVGRDVVGSALVTGDSNTMKIQFKQATIPPASDVNIKAEIEELRQLLLSLTTDKQSRIETALNEAAEDAAKTDPDKNEIGKSLERALDYASKASDFAEKSGKVASAVQNIVGWLGDNWTKLLPLVGLIR